MAKRRRRKGGLRAAKGASGLTKASWRKCAGVNSRTGRIKKGYKATRRGCPTKVR